MMNTPVGQELVERALLYDFYGELLTAHQRSVYEEFVFQDLSLGEIAEKYGISRQGVHDLIRRCNRQLDAYESRLHLVTRFMTVKKKAQALEALMCAHRQQIKEDAYDRMHTLLQEILESL